LSFVFPYVVSIKPLKKQRKIGIIFPPEKWNKNIINLYLVNFLKFFMH